MDTAIELLARLGDDLDRAQRLTGIAPIALTAPLAPEFSVDPQVYGPHEGEAGSGLMRKLVSRLERLRPLGAGSDGASEPELGRRLFDALTERTELRGSPSDEQIFELWPEVVQFVDREPGLFQSWQDFVDEQDHIWTGTQRARSWLCGSATFFEERGRGLCEGLRALGGDGDHTFIAAAHLNMCRVIHHAFAEAFSAAHMAAACLVEFVEFGGQGPIRIHRRAGQLCTFVDRRASRDEILVFAAELGRRDRSLHICAQLLGLLLGITATWTTASLNAGLVIRSMLESVPRVIGLRRELAQLWTPASDQ